MSSAEGWHFGALDRRLGHGDGRLIVTGETLRVDGQIEPCVRGLHASPFVAMALAYATGPVLSRVALSGTVIAHGNPMNKWCASERRELACCDATPVLWVFARSCALDVVSLWDAPEVVVECLRTGDVTLRAAASDAAGGAALAAALAAARATAWAAAGGAAGGAARAALGALGASDAARAAAGGAALAAARVAARAAESDAAWAAALAAAWAVQRDRLEAWAVAYLADGSLPSLDGYSR